MLILGKAVNPDIDYSPNLSAILLFHLAHQANCAQGDISCGGVIIILANSLGLNFTDLHPLAGNRLVNFRVLPSTRMVIACHYYIRIPGMGYLFSTPFLTVSL
jgi:hypothetical protein